MNGIKNMLLGIAILLAVITFHLFAEDALITDFIALAGLFLVIKGYQDDASKKEETDEKM